MPEILCEYRSKKRKDRDIAKTTENKLTHLRNNIKK